MANCSNRRSDRTVDPGADDSAPDSALSADSAAGTALIADDDAAIREVLRLWLTAEGWEIREAENGEQALEKLDETVDVLVTDREMPKCTGPEVVERLDGTTFCGHVIVVSGCPPDSRLSETDVTHYVMKPVRRAELLDRLERTRG